MTSTMVELGLPPVRACLFDMDGLLINSEDIYSKVTNEILAEYGKPELPWSIKARLQGRPGPMANELLLSWSGLPLTVDELLKKQKVLQEKYFPSAQPLPGVVALIKTLRSSPSRPYLALATSSNSHSYSLKTSHLLDELFSLFEDDMIVKGDDPRIPKGRGKPAPDIYLLALEICNKKRAEEMRANGALEEDILATKITPRECLVFEDAVPGVEAGRRAKMRVVWVPHNGLKDEYAGREEDVLAGLTGEGEADGMVFSKKGDGWGEVRGSLTGFDFERYGIKLAAA